LSFNIPLGNNSIGISPSLDGYNLFLSSKSGASYAFSFDFQNQLNSVGLNIPITEHFAYSLTNYYTGVKNSSFNQIVAGMHYHNGDFAWNYYNDQLIPGSNLGSDQGYTAGFEINTTFGGESTKNKAGTMLGNEFGLYEGHITKAALYGGIYSQGSHFRVGVDGHAVGYIQHVIHKLVDSPEFRRPRYSTRPYYYMGRHYNPFNR